jgi:hypothetical protein
VAVRQELAREGGQFGPTPGVPAAASAPGCTGRHYDDDNSVVMATIYNGSPERPKKRHASRSKRASTKKKARSTVSLSTEPSGPNSIPGSVYVTPDVGKTKNAARRYTRRELDSVHNNDEDGQEDSIATTDLPKTDDFISFKLPSPEPSTTESESNESDESDESDDSSSKQPSKNLLNGEYDED